MAQVRGSWFSSLNSSLSRHAMLADVESKLPQITRKILLGPDAQAWYDEGHAVAIYELVAQLRGADACREVGRDAARFAMVSTWRDLMQALIGFLGATPRMAFEQMPVLWNATRRDAGELKCVESSTKHAITELRGFPYASSPAWGEVWRGHHEALLRQLRFSGESHLVSTDDAQGLIRTRTEWTSALGGGAPPTYDSSR